MCEAQCNECLWRTLVPGGQSGVIYMIIIFLGQGGTAVRFVLFFVQLQEVEFLNSEGETQLI